MLLKLTDEQELLLQSLDEVIERSLTPEYLERIDREHREPTEFNEAMVEAGFATLGIPQRFGGEAVDNVTLCLISERVAKAGLHTGYGGAMVQAGDILEFGNEEQQELVMEALRAGKNAFALGISEPGAGSDNMAMTTTAVWEGDNVRLNGVKTLITAAATSDHLLVLAKDADATDPRRAISMYLVPSNTPGITISPLEKIVWHTTNTCEVYLDDVVVPASTLVGAKGNGFMQLMRNFEMERIIIACNCLGQAEYAFELAADHAAQRIQFGQPIGNFQIIQMYLTDMAIKLENMRNLVYKSAAMLDEGLPLKNMGAMTKRYCAQASFEVVDTALQVHGGVGFTEGAPISRLWRDARVNRIGGGTDEIMVHIVGRSIVKEHARTR